jgi:hypothetical protein
MANRLVNECEARFGKEYQNLTRSNGGHGEHKISDHHHHHDHDRGNGNGNDGNGWSLQLGGNSLTDSLCIPLLDRLLVPSLRLTRLSLQWNNIPFNVALSNAIRDSCLIHIDLRNCSLSYSNIGEISSIIAASSSLQVFHFPCVQVELKMSIEYGNNPT